MYLDYDVCYEKFFTFSINYPIGNPKNPIKIKVERVEEVQSERKIFTVDTIYSVLPRSYHVLVCTDNLAIMKQKEIKMFFLYNV
jgi:hypothetical protein